MRNSTARLQTKTRVMAKARPGLRTVKMTQVKTMKTKMMKLRRMKARMDLSRIHTQTISINSQRASKRMIGGTGSWIGKDKSRPAWMRKNKLRRSDRDMEGELRRPLVLGLLCRRTCSCPMSTIQVFGAYVARQGRR